MKLRATSVPHLKAVPAMDHRVSSNPAPFSPAAPSLQVAPNSRVLAAPSVEAPGCPKPSTFRQFGGRIFGSPRIFVPSATPAAKLWVAPHLHPPACLPVVLQVALNRTPAGVAGLPIAGFPRLSRFPAHRSTDLRGTPNLTSPSVAIPASPSVPGSCRYGWANDESQTFLEPCILRRCRG